MSLDLHKGSELTKHLERSAPQFPRDHCPMGQLPSTGRWLAEHLQAAFSTFHLAKRSTKPEVTGTSTTGHSHPRWLYPATTLNPGL